MKRHKSRTFIGRTLSKVKSRITSFGSPLDAPSPNPLIAPPAAPKTAVSPKRTSRAYRTVPQRSPAHDTIRASQYLQPVLDDGAPSGIDGTIDDHPSLQIASLEVKTSTWTVFGTHAKFPATAYVNVEMSCGGSDASRTVRTRTDDQTTSSTQPVVGHLYDLNVTPALTGPGAVIKRYGHSTHAVLSAGEKWTLVLHLGIQDTSLASKLSTSFKSLGGRLGRISNVDVINKWLDVLQKDTLSPSRASKGALKVRFKIEFKHSLLPITTTLSEGTTVQIAMTEDEAERAKIEGVKLGDDSEDEDEERVQELRVMGAPWL